MPANGLCEPTGSSASPAYGEPLSRQSGTASTKQQQPSWPEVALGHAPPADSGAHPGRVPPLAAPRGVALGAARQAAGPREAAAAATAALEAEVAAAPTHRPAAAAAEAHSSRAADEAAEANGRRPLSGLMGRGLLRAACYQLSVVSFQSRLRRLVIRRIPLQQDPSYCRASSCMLTPKASALIADS